MDFEKPKILTLNILSSSTIQYAKLMNFTFEVIISQLFATAQTDCSWVATYIHTQTKHIL